MGFQTTVQPYAAPAVEGDFASSNPRATAVTPVDGAAHVAGVGGLTVARFGWSNASGVVLNSGSGAPTGFIKREMQALIITWLAESGLTIQDGLPVTLFNAGDFWAKATVGGATIGQKVFASLTTGQIQTGAAGATIAGYVETNFKVVSTCLVNELFKMSTWG